MIEAKEKSTAAPEPASFRAARIHPDVLLDPRLAIFHEKSRWLAMADVHYGYELARRSEGGLWPMWGMESIEARLESLLDDYRPETLILVGDVVDSGCVAREALRWLKMIDDRVDSLVLIAGNHDRGMIRSEREFVETFEIENDGFFFHHGHLSPEIPENYLSISGHCHPSVSASDGAGTRLRLPALIQERDAKTGHESWILPAFSPWAGGGRVPSGPEARYWACSPELAFEWADG